MSCSAYYYTSQIAEDAARKIKPQIDALKRDFTAVTDKQQAQLDRIEGQLNELLSLLKPGALSKPSPVKKSGVLKA